MPTLTLIAGPNGSGKSTLTEWVELVDVGLLLDPDAIARTIDPAMPQRAAIAAGREMLRLISSCLDRETSFAVETTLSSRASLGLIQQACDRGYETHLIFIALDTPERYIARVRIALESCWLRLTSSTSQSCMTIPATSTGWCGQRGAELCWIGQPPYLSEPVAAPTNQTSRDKNA